jgi:hypothetical protein
MTDPFLKAMLPMKKLAFIYKEAKNEGDKKKLFLVVLLIVNPSTTIRI